MRDVRVVDRPERGRLLVVSHACVLPVNQHVYVRLAELGWNVTLVVPAYWRHCYETGRIDSRALPEFDGQFIRLPALLPGRPQRHFYGASATKFIRGVQPDVAFFEEETFSLAATQWSLAASRSSIPFGVQAAENLDRRLPLPARIARSWTLRHAAFVAARSPSAGELARQWGMDGDITLVPHALPPWKTAPRRQAMPFTIGFAGRLVPEKGVLDLAQAASRLDGPIRLVFIGDGPLRAELAATHLPNGSLEVRTGVGHDGMPDTYAELDVLVLPSRTTAGWVEQFGRVLVEALWCRVPVVGSDSGEVPWVIATTGGGLLFPEGDVEALTSLLVRLQRSPAERRELAERGGKAVRRMFGVDTVAGVLDAVLLAAIRPSSGSARTLTASATGPSAKPETVGR